MQTNSFPERNHNNGQERHEQTQDPTTLAQKAIANLEQLNEALGNTSTHWLHGMLDVLRIYAENVEEIPDKMLATHSSEGVILRRGLQSFVVSEEEFAEVRNAFRRSKHYRKKCDMSALRQKHT